MGVRIHELAKELNKSSKEVMDFLNKNGVEVKSHMSSIEDTQIEMVKKEFAPKAEAPKVEAPKAEEAKEVLFSWFSPPYQAKNFFLRKSASTARSVTEPETEPTAISLALSSSPLTVSTAAL